MSKNLSTFLRNGNNTAPLPVSVGGTGVTTLTGLVKGTGAVALTAAVAGTDYLAPPTGTSLLKANSGGALANAVAGTDYQTPIGTISGLVKGNGANLLTAAVAGTDYQTPIGTISGLVKGNGANLLTAAVAGTDYLAPPSGTSLLKANSGGALSNAVAGTDYVAPTGSITGTAGGLSSTLAVGSGGTGLATITANSLLLGNGTSALQTVAPGTSGNVLTSNGSTWVSGAAPVSVSTGDIVFSLDSSAHTSPTYLPCDGSKYTSSTYPTLATKIKYSNFDTSNYDNFSDYAIGWDGSMFVSASDTCIRTSTDGVTWVTRKTRQSFFNGSGNACSPTGNGTGSWVICCLGGVWYSTDSGVNWAYTRIVQNNYSGSGLAYGNGKWVLCLTSGALLYSSNASTWTACSGSSIGGSYLKYVNGNFIAIRQSGNGNLLYSSDGITFTNPVTAPIGTGATSSPLSIGFGGTTYVIGCANGLIYSGTSLTTAMTSAVVNNANTYWYDIAYNGTTYVAVGYNATSNSWAIAYSTNATSWTVATLGVTINGSAWQIKTDGTNFVVMGSGGGGHYTSTNGSTWTFVQNALISLGQSYPGLVFGNNKFVVTSTSNAAGIWTSEDAGATWTGRVNCANSVVFNLTNDANFNRVVNNGSIVVIASFGGVVTTTDNVTFTYRKFPSYGQTVSTTQEVIEITYSSVIGKWVAVTSNDLKAFYSSDGITWTVSTTTFGNAPNSVTSSNSLFLIASNGSYVYTSPDGNTWTQRTSVLPTSLFHVNYFNGFFLACLNSNNQGHYYSSDGITWVQRLGSYTNHSRIINDKLYTVYASGNGSSIYLNSSVDGIATGINNPSSFYNDASFFIAYGNNVYVIATYPYYNTVGANSRIYYSNNGIDFNSTDVGTSTSSNTVPQPMGLRFVNGVFILTMSMYSGSYSTYISTDGINWANYTTGIPAVDMSYIGGNLALYASRSFAKADLTSFRTPIISVSIPAYIKA